MSQTLKALFASAASITCTLASLANNGARSALAIDNSSNLYLDALIQCKVKTGSGALANGSYINVYAYASVDGGTTYPDGAGTDTGITLTSPPNVVLVDVISTPSTTTSYISNPKSVAAAFGGILPQKWGLIFENKTGQALDSTGGNFAIQYQGVQQQAV